MNSVNKLPGGKKLKEKMLKTIEGYKKLKEEDKNNLHVYFGYGKGKTTSAIGLAMRMLGAGKKVVIVQFDKGYDEKNEHYSERILIRKLKSSGYNIELYPTGIERMNPDGTFRFKNTGKDIDEAQKALMLSHKFVIEPQQDLLILDEILAAVAYNLIKKEDVERLILEYKQNKKFDLVMTGHKIWKFIEENADLITEMKKIKHYFDKGIPAKPGIEF